MNKRKIVFSPRAKERLESIADYLFEETQSSVFVIAYINSLEQYLVQTLQLFPEAGTPMEEFGAEIRRIVYKEYSFVYRVTDVQIEILTIYRENLP